MKEFEQIKVDHMNCSIQDFKI